MAVSQEGSLTNSGGCSAAVVADLLQNEGGGEAAVQKVLVPRPAWAMLVSTVTTSVKHHTPCCDV